MPHRRKPRRAKIDRQLITREQAVPQNVLPFPTERTRSGGENLVRTLSPDDLGEVLDRIVERYDEAEPFTEDVTDEIERAERQFHGLFKGQELYQEPDKDDNSIFMRKTMEHMQVVFSHLDALTNQLKPLLTLQPAISGLYPVKTEFERAKVKEILVNTYLDKNKFKPDILPRWRWNFLRHPSAYLRVIYQESPNRPDIRIDVVDRGALYIDPNIVEGDVKHAGWVIEKDWITREQAEELVREGFYEADEDEIAFREMGAQSVDPIVQRMQGKPIGQAERRGPDQDRLIERWHYWQAPKNGQPHAYGVVLGGRDGTLVRWGPIPYPYKGIPYRGKSYIRDPYRPDGVSLAMQYRSIQEIYNTFLNLRIDDVLENVKRRIFLFSQLFGKETREDHDNDQKYVRLDGSFMQEIIQQGRSLKDFMWTPDNGDSTQHLLRDLQMFTVEGKEETSIGDVFRGQNPQSGATLGQVQEQLFRAIGVFRPVFTQEMSLIEEVGEIICTYFEDEEFFGDERIVQIFGPNRYKDAVQGFLIERSSGMAVRNVFPDEMDVDVTVDVVSKAEAMASRTMRLQIVTSILDATRHHPELMREASKVINFPNILLQWVAETGEDIDSITYSEQEQEQNAKERQAQRQAAIKEQIALLRAEGEAKGITQAVGARAKGQAQMGVDKARIAGEHQARLTEALAEIQAKHRAELRELREEFLQELQKMRVEAKLERQSNTQLGHGNNINQ